MLAASSAFGSSGEDCAIVLPEDGQPVIDVAGMMIEMRDRQAEFRTQHGAG
jgi:hypothetical protein